MKNKYSSLYIHIPFCDCICSYCDFPKLLKKTGYEEKYIEALIFELSQLPVKTFSTIYVGGGTPTALDDNLFNRLFSYIRKNIKCLGEFSVEANPESMSYEKALLMAQNGVNRVSLGVQTIDDSILKILNRNHNANMVIKAINNIKSVGINNVNMDFIYGLPNQDIEKLKRDIDFALSFDPNHLSFYPLQIEEGTVLFNKKVKEPLQDELDDYYEMIISKLKEKGIERYEISNFAKSGFESKHNLTYWHSDDYYACGLGATGFVDGLRYKNTLNINKYINHEFIYEKNYEDLSDQEFDFLMLNLRLVSGFSLNYFYQRFNHSFLIDYKDEIEKVKDYLDIDEDICKVKEKYLYILDSILVDLLHFKEN